MPEPANPFAFVGAVVSTVLLIGLIVFLAVEFMTDPFGSPIYSGVSSTVAETLADEVKPPQRKRLFSPAEIQSQFRIVTPLNHSRIEAEWVTVLCHWTPPTPDMEEPPVQPQLFWAEKLIPWTMRFGSNTWFARVPAESGEHHLHILGQDLTVVVHPPVAASRSGSGKAKNRLIVHEGTDDPACCGECHLIIDGRHDIVHKSRALTIGPLRPSEACFSCHDIDDADRCHSKLTEPPGNDCANCHRLHGKIAE